MAGMVGAVIWIARVAGLAEVGECWFLVVRKRGAVSCGVPGSLLFEWFLGRRLVWFLLWFPLLWFWGMDDP